MEILLGHRCKADLAAVPGQSGPGSNGNEGVFHIYRSGASPPDVVKCYI